MYPQMEDCLSQVIAPKVTLLTEILSEMLPTCAYPLVLNCREIVTPMTHPTCIAIIWVTLPTLLQHVVKPGLNFGLWNSGLCTLEFGLTSRFQCPE